MYRRTFDDEVEGVSVGAAQLQVKGVGSVGGEEANGQLLLLAFFFFSSRQCLLVGNHKITGSSGCCLLMLPPPPILLPYSLLVSMFYSSVNHRPL